MQSVPAFNCAARSADSMIFSSAIIGYFSISAVEIFDCEQ